MKFQPAIEFPVHADGNLLSAKVLEEVEHPVQTIYRVAFSDGFEDEFLLEDDGNVYGSGIASIPYAKAIRFDMGHLIGLDAKRFYHIFQRNIDGLNCNVWVVEGDHEDGRILYKVYYFDYFRFALTRNSQHWFVSHQPQYGKTPDPLIVREVGFLLDSLLEASK